MSLYLERKYISLISNKLNGFKWKSQTLANFKCTFCGDSKKVSKQRGYFYEKKGSFIYFCHNCNVSMAFFNFLKLFDDGLYRQYILEKFKKEEPESEEEVYKKSYGKTPLKFINLTAIPDLPVNHYARKYIEERKIPKDRQFDLYYTDDFEAFVKATVPDKAESLLEKDARIVIPFRDQKNDIVLYQGRSLDKKNKQRYIAIRVVDDCPKIFGLERFKKEDVGYIVEGPIDSMFLPNSLAAGGSHLSEVLAFIDRDKQTFIFDNEKRNKQIIKSMDKVIELGYKIFIWPSDIERKDINELILGGFSSSEIQMIISNNTFDGLNAKLHLQQWKRV